MRGQDILEAGDGRTKLVAAFQFIGRDLVVMLSGEGAHLGASSLAEPEAGGEVRSGTMAARNHRDSELTGAMARKIAGGTGRRVAVLGGVHLDGIGKDEIRRIIENGDRLTNMIRRAVGEGGR